MNYKKICLLALLFIVGTKINGQSKSNISRNYKVVLKEQNRFKIKKLEVKGITILPNSNLLLGGWNVVEFDINTLNKHKRIPEKKWFNNGMGYISSIVSDNNNYYLVDNRDKRLIRYSILNDTLKYDLKPFKRLEEGIYMGKNNYVVTHFQKSNDWEYQFSIYNIFDKKVTKTYKFKDIIDDKNFSRTCADFQLQGMFSSNLKHTFYVCEKASKFFSFNQDGELLYSKSTLFNLPLPKSKEKKFMGGRTCELSPKYSVIRYATNNDNFLYILSNKRNSNKKFCIDMYSTVDGKYYSSILVPYLDTNRMKPYPNLIKVYDNKMIIKYDETLVVYEINPL